MKRISTCLFLCVTASTLSAAALFPKETEAFLELHCFDCHGAGYGLFVMDLEKTYAALGIRK